MRINFYLGQNEHCSPGDSTSDSSKRLLKRGSEGRSIYKILVKGSSMQSSAYFTKDFLLVTDEEMMSSCKENIVFSTVGNGFKVVLQE